MYMRNTHGACELHHRPCRLLTGELFCISTENHQEQFFLEEQHVVEQSTSKTNDTTEPGETAIMLGWEVLEADDTSTEKEESSGLVKSIVDVFHRG